MWRCDAFTRVTVDDGLVRTAQELGGHATRTAAARAALEAYVRAKALDALLELIAEGGVEYDEDYDYKAERIRGIARIPVEDWDDSADALEEV